LSEWEVLISCPLYKSSLLKKIKGFDEKLPYGQENDLHIRLSFIDAEFVYFPAKTFHYRTHDAESRLSIIRTSARKNSFWVDSYRMNKLLQLLNEKFKTLDTIYIHFLSETWFRMALTYYYKGFAPEGNYFLHHSRNIIPDRIPRYKNSKVFPLLFVLTGKIVGYYSVAKMIKMLRPGKNAKSNKLLDKVFPQQTSVK
jgi:GT2 family glycosyltransferase